MAKYNLTIVTHPGLTIHHAFDEIRDSLAWSLSSLGHSVSDTEDWFSEQQETNIIFGTELIADFQRLPAGSICYNLEQPSHPRMEVVRRIVKESGATVWDYSQRAVAEWRSAGFDNVHYVPIGYTPNLTRIPHSPSPDIDIFFAGWMTPRRTALLDELRATGLTVASASAACYGGVRDNLLSRSKVCLNVHHDGRDRFEAVRVSYLMANSKCVVTESSSDDDEYEDLKHGIAIYPYRMLVEMCKGYSSNTVEGSRHGREELAFDDIRKRDYTVAVAAALDSTPSVVPSHPITFRQGRAQVRTDFMAKARFLPPTPRDSRVAARYSAALAFGDMKDFVPWLRNHAKGNVVEIGVRDGASTSAFLSGVEEHGGHLWSIDIQPCGELFAGHPQWSFLQADSKDIQSVIKFIPFEIDVLLLDGDHSRAGVLNDIEYARQLRPGGIVLFHDIRPEDKPYGCTDMSWPGDDVKNVYEALCDTMSREGWTHEEPPGRYGLGVLRKPPAVPATLPERVECVK